MLLQCQLQLFEENRWLAWELFWVASLWSGSSTVTYLNWAASCVDCEMNWSVASQLNRAHSSQRGDHLARPSQSNREPIPSIPTLRNVRLWSLGSKLCHTSAYRLNKSHHTPPPPLSSQSNHPLQPFLWKTIATHSPLEEAHSRANNARAIFAPSSVRCPISR